MALDPAERFSSAAAFDSGLALSRQSRQFVPRHAHDGHVRCWTVTGAASELRVCVLAGPRPKRVFVQTRHENSGNRVVKHCFETTERDLPRRLRAVFNDLR
jgi:hypothetical protein